MMSLHNKTDFNRLHEARLQLLELLEASPTVQEVVYLMALLRMEARLDQIQCLGSHPLIWMLCHPIPHLFGLA